MRLAGCAGPSPAHQKGIGPKNHYGNSPGCAGARGHWHPGSLRGPQSQRTAAPISVRKTSRHLSLMRILCCPPAPSTSRRFLAATKIVKTSSGVEHVELGAFCPDIVMKTRCCSHQSKRPDWRPLTKGEQCAFAVENVLRQLAERQTAFPTRASPTRNYFQQH